jgi:CRP/FNR family transcriptional regulator, cyclic AMP receptor protein
MRKALYILGELDEPDIRWLAEQGEHRSVSAGDVLIREGEPVDTLFVVTDGVLEVVAGGGRRIAKLVSGDIVGEMSLVEKRPPAASVRAVEEARVLSVPHETISKRLGKDPAFAARFYRALAVFLSDRLRATVSQLGYGDPGEDEAGLGTGEELDEGLLDTIHVAGDRMRRLIAILEGAER